MNRLPRILPQLALACSFISLPLLGVSRVMAQAQPETAQPETAQPAPTDAPATEAAGDVPVTEQPPEPTTDATPRAEATVEELVDPVEDFWHYGKVARYDLAKAKADEIISKSGNPQAVLNAFEQVTRERRDNLDEWLLRWQGVPELQQSSTDIINILRKGHYARRQDPAVIESHLDQLGRGERAYQLAMNRLRDAGELAVPLMIDRLNDPNRRDEQPMLRRALRDLGRPALNPLVAATEMNDVETLITVIGVLGDIGYDVAIPYLAKIAGGPQTPQAVRSAALAALSRMGVDGTKVNAADAFYDLAEKFYYDNAAISADTRDPNQPASMWYWNNRAGLTRKEVPQQIFNELMAMRASEYALKLGSGRDATSLWLASNYKREAELPEGATDPTRAEGQPDAHYYGVTTGPEYLTTALDRALRDRNFPVAYRVVRSLQEIVGQSNLFADNASARTLVNAMGSADRLVRYEAALALASALPQQPFDGQEQVIPLLAEALSQTGTPSALVVMKTQEQSNALVESLKEAGYVAAGAANADAAIAAANTLPNVDVIVISEDLGVSQVNTLLENASNNQRLRGSTRLIITASGASPFATRAATDRSIIVTQATDPAALKTQIDQARTRGSTLTVDPAIATDYSLRAAELLAQLAVTRGQVLDLSAAETPLLSALNDARPEVVKAAGRALGFYETQGAQVGLLSVAAKEQTADDLKISLYDSLTNNARFYGNKLEPDQINTLDQVVTSATNLDVRSAAAEARGALNLPADQAKQLIVQQSTGTEPIQ